MGQGLTHTVVLTYGDAEAEDEESSLPHMVDNFQSKLPPGILPPGLPKVKDMEPAIIAVEAEQQQKKETKQSEYLSSSNLIPWHLFRETSHCNRVSSKYAVQ